jgi:hypothetical protein
MTKGHRGRRVRMCVAVGKVSMFFTGRGRAAGAAGGLSTSAADGGLAVASSPVFSSYLLSGRAYSLVHSLAVAMAACSFSFQLLATSAARGSSGLGAPRRAWMERRIVRICSAGDQLSVQG